MSRSRSWVRGRAGFTPCCSYAIAVASTAPIQIGRYRSPSTSLSSTIGWLLGSSTRTPTTFSSRTAAPFVSPTSPCTVHAAGPSRCFALPSERLPQPDADQRRVQPLGQRGELAHRLVGAVAGGRATAAVKRRHQLREQAGLPVGGHPVGAQVPGLQAELGQRRGRRQDVHSRRGVPAARLGAEHAVLLQVVERLRTGTGTGQQLGPAEPLVGRAGIGG